MTGAAPSEPPGIPDRARAFVATAAGGSVDTAVMDLPADDLGEGDVLVAVEWSAVNYKDGMATRPGNRVARRSPLVPGVDLAGRVLASDDPSIPPGRPVVVQGYDLGVGHHGGFAEMARVPAGWVVPLAAGADTRRAAIVGTAGFTAALSLARLEQVGLGPTAGPVVVTGAAGGVGSMTVALLAARGYEVVASTGRASEAAYLHDLGAREVVGREEVTDQPGRTLGSERWAGAVDCVGGRALAGVLRSLRYGGAVAASGLTGGADLETSVYPFIVRGVALLGVDTVQTPIGLRRSVWAWLADAYPPPLLDRMVGEEVGLDGLDRVLATVLSGGVRGRVLVRPGA